MDEPSATIDPAPGRRAQLLLALLLGSIVPMLPLLHPPQTHVVKLDLHELPAAAETAAAPGTPAALLLSSLFLPPPFAQVPRGLVHTLELRASGEILLDGEEMDPVGLRARLDVIAGGGVEWVEFRPDEQARYERFVEILALTKRARLERLHVDQAPFRRAIA